MKTHDPRARLRALVRARGTQTAVAAELGISKAYLHDILKGRRDLSDAVLAKLGLVRVESFVEKTT